MSSPARRVAYVVGAGVVIILALALLLQVLRVEPGRQPGINSDALGPENGEPVGDYLSAAADTLEGEGGAAADDDPRWALITLERAASPEEASRLAEPLERVSRVVVQTPREGLAMPVMWKDVAEPASEPRRDRSGTFGVTLERLAHGTELAAEEGEASRSSSLALLSVGDIERGRPAIIGLVAWSGPGELREVAGADAVRAVEALPADAIWNRFAVRPLLPQQTGVVAPLPDHGALPEPEVLAER